jgi:hypothetical protein
LEAIRVDRFPEAFRRFEEVVDVRRIQSFRQLRLAFASWAGWKWHDTYLQNRALAVEARRLGIPVFVERSPDARFHGRIAVTWRREVVKIRGKAKSVYRDLKTGRFIKKPK